MKHIVVTNINGQKNLINFDHVTNCVEFDKRDTSAHEKITVIHISGGREILSTDTISEIVERIIMLEHKWPRN